MANLDLDRKKPEIAIPILAKAVNNFFPVGTRLKIKGNPPSIGTWEKVSVQDSVTEYERVR